MNEIENNQVNLCESCSNQYPECGADDIYFGDATGNDNICCCNKYEPIVKHDYVRGGFM